MNPHRSDLEEHYRQQDTQELLLIAGKDLTELARSVLHAELVSRGVGLDQIEQARQAPAQASPPHKAPERPVTRPVTWEWVVVALISVVSLVQLGSLVMILQHHWDLTKDSLANGTMSWWIFLLPLLWFSAAALLAFMRKWAVPLIALHLIASIAYGASLTGFAKLPPSALLGYCIEALTLLFGVHLLGKGRLR